MKAFFGTFFYSPIYNLVVFCALYVPGGDIGLAIILATIVVKVVLLPLSLSAVRTQKTMKKIEGHVKKIKEDHKDDREQQARATLALYKEHGVRPFMSMLSMLVQIPFIIALYFVVLHQSFPAIDHTILYPFMQVGDLHVSLYFLGFLDITQKSVILAAIAGLAQLAMGVYTVPKPEKTEAGGASEDFARAMNMQMRFVLPLIITFVAYTSGAIALYFVTSALFAIGQEYFVRKTHHTEPAPLF